MAIDRKAFLWLILKSDSFYVGTEQSGNVVTGRDAAYCWELPRDRNEERCSSCDGRCRKEWLPAVVLIGLQGVAKAVCGGIMLQTIPLNVRTEGYKNLFIVMGYVPDNTAYLAFMGLQGVVLFYTHVGHYRP
jgi:hypothetical protein